MKDLLTYPKRVRRVLFVRRGDAVDRIRERKGERDRKGGRESKRNLRCSSTCFSRQIDAEMEGSWRSVGRNNEDEYIPRLKYSLHRALSSLPLNLTKRLPPTTFKLIKQRTCRRFGWRFTIRYSHSSEFMIVYRFQAATPRGRISKELLCRWSPVERILTIRETRGNRTRSKEPLHNRCLSIIAWREKRRGTSMASDWGTRRRLETLRGSRALESIRVPWHTSGQIKFRSWNMPSLSRLFLSAILLAVCFISVSGLVQRWRYELPQDVYFVRRRDERKFCGLNE